MDVDAIAGDLVKALRGKRPQAELSKRLGYRTNVVYAWEAGRRSPTATDFFKLAEKSSVDVTAALAAFYPTAPSWLSQCRMTRPSDVARLLSDLASDVSANRLAESIDASRATVVRWLAGKSEPRLPDLLSVVEVTTGRLLDFVATFTEPSHLESLRGMYAAAEARRRLAADRPISEAILAALDLNAYQRLETHRSGVIARRLGITTEEETTILDALAEARLVELQRGLYRRASDDQDTEEVPGSLGGEAGGALAALSARRAEGAGSAVSSFEARAISKKVYGQLLELERAHERAVRQLVSESKRGECVALIAHSLVRLDE
jgi:transcriptional regulator with XRE-family HTH domain